MNGGGQGADSGAGLHDGGRAARIAGAFADRLALAATPVFALMALLAAVREAGAMATLCGAGASLFDGMAWMYALMSVLHAGPWLRRLARPPCGMRHPPSGAGR
ncbi:hypothetical protein [Achromobacter xylosoxidans]|uniref:hypothetical protein n=1 Tax=Alcaligenes xylosoxydans xylosoxydans TaxID=85698 RepID=UPI001F12D802|nr:hypothetical protein [Achromobacter xylosoxidans]